MLTPLLLTLALTPAPARGVAPAPGPAALPQSGTSMGCNRPRCLSRRAINRQLEQLGGFALFDAHRACIDWLVLQGETEVMALGDEGRQVGSTLALSLALLGTGGNVQAGVARFPLRFALAFLKERQDAESGAFGDPGREEYLLEQSLALLVLSEACYADEMPERREQAQLAAKALLAGRGADGLWHEGGADDAPVDALVSSLAGYALFSAQEAGVEVPAEACEPILAWSGEIAERAAEAADGELGREEALLYAAALCARMFSAQVLGRELAGDEALAHLARRVAAQVPTPPGTEEEWELPARLAEADFTFLATLGLFQADNEAWGRSSQWSAAILLRSIEHVEEDEGLGRFPAGETGRFPGGRLGTTALRVLAMQSGVRELHLSVLVD